MLYKFFFTKCIPNLCSPNFQNPFYFISLYNCCILSPLVEEFHVQFPPQEKRSSVTNSRFCNYEISLKIKITCSIGIHEREKRIELLPCHIFYLSWQKSPDIAWLGRFFFYIIAQIAMLLSNYQLLTLYNNLLDIIALIYINLVNIVGALSKWKQLYQLPYFYSFGNHLTCSFHPTLLTLNIKRMIAL